MGSGVTTLRNTAGQTVGYVANNPNARYIVAGQGVFPNGGRNTFRTPGINNWDVTAAKKFNISETKYVEFRAAFLNFFNHPQYVLGYPSLATQRSRTGAAAYMTPSSALFNRPDLAFESNARNGQLGLRYVF